MGSVPNLILNDHFLTLRTWMKSACSPFVSSSRSPRYGMYTLFCNMIAISGWFCWPDVNAVLAPTSEFLNHAIVPRKEWRGDLSLWTSRVRSIFWRDKRGMKKLTQRVSYKTNEWVQCGLNSLIPPGLLHRILWQSVDYFLNTFSYIQLDYSSFTIWIRFQLFPDGYDLSHSESTLKTITAIDLSI